MKHIYCCEFTGREHGAIGISYHIVAEVKSETPLTDRQVWQALYEKPHDYECIMHLHINSRLVNIGDL